MKKKKNGELELLRFIMCLIILFFHFNKHMLGHTHFPGTKWGFFQQGSMGVEFFFVCSGFLMAASAAREYRANPIPDDKMLGKSTSSFIFRKIRAFLPYHVIAFFMAWLVWISLNWKGVAHAVKMTVDCIPSFFLIHMSGWKMGNPQFVEWYLSVMVLAMLVLFPLIRKHYHVFTRVIAPALGLLLLGYLFQKYHRLGGVKVWDTITYRAMLRGVAEICLGAFTYELVQILREKINVAKIKVINTILYVGGIIIFILFCCRSTKHQLQFFMVPLAMLLVGVCFLGGTCFGKAVNNRVVMFLGKFSLPLYLAQVVGVRIAESRLLPKSMGTWPRIAIGIVLSIIAGLIVMWIGDFLQKKVLNRAKPAQENGSN